MEAFTPLPAPEILLFFLLPALVAAIVITLRCRHRVKEELRHARKYIIQAEQTSLLLRMIAGIAHDLNSSTGVIISAFSFLKENNGELNQAFLSDTLTKSKLEEHIRIEDETTRIVAINLEKIAELVKSFKRVTVDQAHETVETFNIQEYIRQIIVSLNPRIRKSAVTVRLSGDSALALTASPGAFSQVLTNLLDNALIHAFAGRKSGEIEISTKEENGEAIITVSDNGIGMEPSVREKIFAPFFTTRPQEGGTGLGLYVASMLVQNSLKGTIECESRMGIGTSFTLRLPLPDKARSPRDDR